MNNTSVRLRKIIAAAIIAAVYAALTFAVAPISYGPVQYRISEVLCILPFFMPFTAWGLFAGCIIANLLSAYGPLDIIFGSIATLGAALTTAYLGRLGQSKALKALGCFPPVIFNAVIVGAVIAWTTVGEDAFWPTFVSFGASVGFGELVVLYIIGFPLMIYLPKARFFRKIVGRYGLSVE